MKILIIQQKMIGDVLTTSVLFDALKERYPQSELHYVLNSHTYPVVQEHPHIDRFHFFTKEAENSKKALFQFLKVLKAERYDVLIDVYSKLSSNLMTLFSGAKTKISIHKPYTAFLYHHTFKNAQVKKTIAGLAIENRLQLLAPLEVDTSKLYRPKIYLTKEEIAKSAAYLKDNGIALDRPIFMIGVLGSSPIKTYPAAYMAKVLDQMVAQTKGQLLFNYIPKQAEDAKAIYDLCTPETQAHIYFEVFGKSLREFLSITHHCTALIGNEGGATNMAKALGIPTFTIFSPWIKKEAWNMFDDGERHVSVHLNDYDNSPYKDIEHPKALKAEASALYQKFNPETFSGELQQFLERF